MPRRGPASRATACLVTAVLTAAVVLVAAPGWAGAAPASPGQGEQEPGVETTENTVAPEQDIIPQPNSGAEPSDAGDRGGALQLAVLAAVVVGVGLIAALGVREARRNRRGPGTPAGARAP